MSTNEHTKKPAKKTRKAKIPLETHWYSSPFSAAESPAFSNICTPRIFACTNSPDFSTLVARSPKRETLVIRDLASAVKRLSELL